MSLNAHVETPYTPGFTLEDLGLPTDSPFHTDTSKPTAIIETDMTGSSLGQTTMSDEEISQIPDWDNKILIIKQNADKLVDMKDIQADIEGDDSMSSLKANAIEATFESFYSPSNISVAYTEFDSKTNLSYTKRFMDSKIKATTEALITEFRSVNPDAVAALGVALADTKEFCTEELRDQINDSINKIMAIRSKIEESTILLPFSGDRFIDMTTANLMDIDLSEVKYGVPISNECRLAFDKLKAIWKSNLNVRVSVTLMANTSGVNPGREFLSIPEQLDMALIISAFTDVTSSMAYTDIAKELSQQQGKLDDHIQKYKDIDTDRSDCVNLIRSGAAELASVSSSATITHKNAKDLGDFAQVASIVALGLVSMQ